jgi:hypothetical protein
MPADESLPGTLKRSPKRAQETWLKTHDDGQAGAGARDRAQAGLTGGQLPRSVLS